MKPNTESSYGPLDQARLLAYLRGSLPRDEHAALEHYLETDRDVLDVISGYAGNEESPEVIAEQLSTLRYRYTRARSRTRRRWAVALGLLVLLAAMGYRYWQVQAGPRLAAEYFSPAPRTGYLVIRGEQAPSEAELQALAWYEQGAYDHSLTAFHQVTANDQQAQRARLYAGLSAYQLGQFNTAASDFQRILSQENILHAEAHWYLALTYLMDQQLTQAKPHLQWLAARAGDYAGDAAEILQALE